MRAKINMRKRRRGLSGRGKNLILFFSTIIQGLHVSEVEYIFMNPEKTQLRLRVSVALFLFSLFFLPCSLSDGVTLCFRPPMRLKLDKKKTQNKQEKQTVIVKTASITPLRWQHVLRLKVFFSRAKTTAIQPPTYPGFKSAGAPNRNFNSPVKKKKVAAPSLNPAH